MWLNTFSGRARHATHTLTRSISRPFPFNRPPPMTFTSLCCRCPKQIRCNEGRLSERDVAPRSPNYSMESPRYEPSDSVGEFLPPTPPSEWAATQASTTQPPCFPCPDAWWCPRFVSLHPSIAGLDICFPSPPLFPRTGLLWNGHTKLDINLFSAILDIPPTFPPFYGVAVGSIKAPANFF